MSTSEQDTTTDDSLRYIFTPAHVVRRAAAPTCRLSAVRTKATAARPGERRARNAATNSL